MDILQSIDTNVSSMVTSSFDEFISTKVKEAVEKEKEKFLEDLNMCEEEYPVNEVSGEFRIMGLSFPGIGSGHSERCFSYITNLGNLHRLPPLRVGDGVDTEYTHPTAHHSPQPTPEIMKWRQANNEVVEYKPVKLNNEYIEILKLFRSKSEQPRWNPLFFQMCDIYAKYHPRANEHFVIEEKLKTVEEKERQVDQIVEMKSRQTRKELGDLWRNRRKELEKEKENYGEKIKQVNEEKLKRIFSMFILRNERKENIKDKSTIREMIKHSNDKCKKKEQEQEIRLKTQQQELNSERIEFEKEKEQFCAEKEDYENTFKSKAKLLLDIANDINEINELQEDTTEKSEELFNLMKQLNELK